MPTFMIAVYAVDQGMNPDIAFYTCVVVSIQVENLADVPDPLSISVLNAASTFGRLIPNIFGNKIGK